jgi:hypothetical protein
VPKAGDKMNPFDFFKGTKITATAAVAKKAAPALPVTVGRGSPDLFEADATPTPSDLPVVAALGRGGKPPIVHMYERKRTSAQAEGLVTGVPRGDSTDSPTQSQVLDANGFVVNRDPKRLKSAVSATSSRPTQGIDNDDDLDELVGMCSGAFSAGGSSSNTVKSTTTLAPIADDEMESPEIETEELVPSAVYNEEFGADDGVAGFFFDEADVSGDSEQEDEGEDEEVDNADESDEAFSDDGNNFDRLRLDAAASEAAGDSAFIANLVARHVVGNDDDDSDAEERRAKREADEEASVEQTAEARKQAKKDKKKKRRERRELKRANALEKSKSAEDSQRDMFASDDESANVGHISEPDSSGDEDEKAKDLERQEKNEWLRSKEQEHSRMMLMTELTVDSKSMSRVEDLRALSRARSGSGSGGNAVAAGEAATAPTLAPKAHFAGIGKGNGTLSNVPKKVARKTSRSYLAVAKKSDAWATAAGAAKKGKKNSGGSFIFDVSRDGMNEDSNSRSMSAPTSGGGGGGGGGSFAGKFSKRPALTSLGSGANAKAKKASKAAAALTKRRSTLMAGLNQF